MSDRPSGASIAVVDDDPSILKSLAYLLESADHTVRVFASASAMLQSGCLATIDCVISDIDIPVMDGFALAQAVHQARPGLPVVFITGHPEMLDRLSRIDAPHHFVFKKPFDGEELLATVEEAVRRSRRYRPES